MTSTKKKVRILLYPFLEIKKISTECEIIHFFRKKVLTRRIKIGTREMVWLYFHSLQWLLVRIQKGEILNHSSCDPS